MSPPPSRTGTLIASELPELMPLKPDNSGASSLLCSPYLRCGTRRLQDGSQRPRKPAQLSISCNLVGSDGEYGTDMDPQSDGFQRLMETQYGLDMEARQEVVSTLEQLSVALINTAKSAYDTYTREQKHGESGGSIEDGEDAEYVVQKAVYAELQRRRGMVSSYLRECKDEDMPLWLVGIDNDLDYERDESQVLEGVATRSADTARVPARAL